MAEHRKRKGIWRREHYLDKMTLKQLVVAFFQYYTVLTYLALAAVSIAVAVWNPPSLAAGLAAVAAAVVIYPMVWYVLHRWVLHSQWMYKSPLTAAIWKRTHYDHHQDPNRLEVLFGALSNTLPTIALATIPAGWLIGGLGGAAVCFATGLIYTCFYEFAHCIQHLSYKPKNRWLANMKKRHVEHHFHDEKGNFGVTSFWPDRIFGTYYCRRERPEKSPTVFNLGYTEKMAARYPWVARLSDGVEKGHPRRRGATPRKYSAASRTDAA